MISILLLVLATALPAPAATPPSNAPSRVYYAFDSGVLGRAQAPEKDTVRRMVDALVMRLTDQPTIAKAWGTLLDPGDVVGIKVSTSAGLLGGTKEAVAAAVAAGLREAGFPRERIIVWDRGHADLAACGFREDAPDYTLRWIHPTTGYDPKAQVSAPVLGRLIWGDSRFEDLSGQRFVDRLISGERLSNKSYYAKILSSEVTKVIHIPAATDSIFTGINGAIADMTLSNLDNWRRFARAPDYGDPYLAEIYADGPIRKKVVLTLLDALIVQFAGGPSPNPNFTVDNATLFLSRDPVAIDALLIEMVDAARQSGKLPPIRPMTGYVESAHALGLGESSPDRVQTLRVGPPKQP